ncbi:hypothetical protein [Noviherbaspirillum sedimenti]|uniref:hypothetical protein n=1 Tax=Noviherbaspirillum sedimenti TaxID=2320865 RepID=UPI001314EA1F|nr:hypothetical protein [Noviherbaspirillum sedimenti]
MQERVKSLTEAGAIKKPVQKSFNYNKLQAVLCIAASALLSIVVIAWAARVLF